MTLEFHPRAGGPFVSKFRGKRKRGGDERTLYDVVRDVIEKLGPKAEQPDILQAAEKEVMADGDLIELAVKHALINVYSAIKRAADPDKDKPAKPESTAAATAREERADRLLTKAREFGAGVSKTLATILDLTMPNGKQLRHCTFGEVAAAGERFAKIAALGKPDQIVGDVITAKRAAKL